MPVLLLVQQVELGERTVCETTLGQRQLTRSSVPLTNVAAIERGNHRNLAVGDAVLKQLVLDERGELRELSIGGARRRSGPRS